MTAHPGFQDPIFLQPTEVLRAATTTDEGPAKIAWLIKDTMAQAGWSVIDSGNGSTGGLGTDVWTTVNDVWAGLDGGGTPWVVLEAPNDDNDQNERQQFFLQLVNNTISNQWRMKHSRAAGFVGGSPGANQGPTATDEFVFRGGGTEASPTGVNLFSNYGGGPYAGGDAGPMFGVVDQARNSFMFCVISYGSSGTPSVSAAPAGVFWLDSCRGGAKVNGEVDRYPYVFYADNAFTDTKLVGINSDSGTLGEQACGYVWYGVGAGQWEAGNLRLTPTWGSFTSNNQFNRLDRSDDSVDDAIDITPGGFWTRTGFSSSFQGRYGKGFSSILFLKPHNNGDAGTPWRNIWNHGDDVRALIDVGGDFCVAWDGTNIPALGGNSGNWTERTNSATWEDQEPAVTLSLVSALSGLSPAEGELAATYDAARYQAISFTVETPSGFGPMVFATIGEDSAFPLVIYDPTDGFAPMFDERSSVVDNGDSTYTFSILPIGGWWRSSLTMRIGSYKEAS